MKKNVIIFIVCLGLTVLAVRSCRNQWSGLSSRSLWSGLSFRTLKLEMVFTDPGARELALAAATGKTRRIDELLAQGVNINYAGQHGITPIRWALASENYRGFSYLLDRGADPNLDVRDGWHSVLHSAARKDDTRFLIKALEKGGKPNLVD